VEKMYESCCSGRSGLEGKLIGEAEARWSDEYIIMVYDVFKNLDRTGVMEIGRLSESESDIAYV
jgi:hypothetical protein